MHANAKLLEEGEEGEEEEPEDAHAVPVPGGGVYEDLAVFQQAGGVQAVERGEEQAEAEGRDGWRGCR